MTRPLRDFNAQNIHNFILAYEESISEVGHAIQGLKGIPLIEALKRKRVEIGPYSHVALFEAANRIMSDLVILHGVKCLLDSSTFPFDSYKVELGHENNNDFDVIASNGSETLVGEAFNVASSFFPTKKNAALKKLRTKSRAPTYQVLMFNHDAVKDAYKPKPRAGEYFLFVDITASTMRTVPDNSFKPNPLLRTA